MTQGARGGKRCPKKQEKFQRRVSSCWRAMFSSFDPDDPEEYCSVYQYILTCIEDWITKCSHRAWLDQEEIEREELAPLRAIMADCPQ
ncbi:hypothetical protein BaRGS_00034369 [Batillaria attramentaria]|uniref:Uncharacterized protein n=1 Tax=Batillaria attramentaria TaxID=370345 RepID=A0ABD0JI39_9CAEN